MPWMICPKDHRYYAMPSMMDTEPCPKCEMAKEQARNLERLLTTGHDHTFYSMPKLEDRKP